MVIEAGNYLKKKKKKKKEPSPAARNNQLNKQTSLSSLDEI